MKHLLIILMLIILTNSIFGQDKVSFFVNEFSLSINRTNINNANNVDKFGFGLGIYHLFFNNKCCNIITGLEYNRINYFTKFVNEYSQVGYGTNQTNNLNSYSLPVGFRLNYGNKTKFFIETGIIINYLIIINEKGTEHISPQFTQYMKEESQYTYKSTTSSSGLYFGLGFRIPISKFELIIKPDYIIEQMGANYDNFINKYFRLSIGINLI